MRTKYLKALLVSGVLFVAIVASLYGAYRLARHFRPKPLLMAGQDHAVAPAPNAARMANPIEGAIRDARNALSQARVPPNPTGIDRDDYLILIEGVVDHFRQLQSDGGEIEDPFAQREIQYSTPSYALAAAVLVESGKRPDLLESASKALSRALQQLAAHRAAGKTGDFFINPAMMAYRKLRHRVDPALGAQWDRDLGEIDPDLAYSDRIGAGQPDVMNWNTNAIVGEYLRHKQGFTDDSFIARYLDAQLPRFSPQGMYRDPALPLVYDSAARYNFLILLQEGYNGPHRAALEILLRRGIWASLLMQSPTGDFPIAGRSAGHVWNDALQCAAFELAARRAAARGDRAEAGTLKRAAHLSAQAAARWRRPSGEFWIVKNHFDPAARFGYEEYSYHSQYNLLAAAYLALAWSFSDEAIREGPTPAETGGFLVDVPQFHMIFANVGGHYLEIDMGGDAEHNGTGLIRDDKRVPGDAADKAPIGDGGAAIGIAWRKGGKVEALAQFPADRVKARLISKTWSNGALTFAIQYDLKGDAVRSVRETYVLDPDIVVVRAEVDGPVDDLVIRYPAFSTDGRDQAAFTADATGLAVHVRGLTRTFRIMTPATPLRKTNKLIHDRSGFYMLFEASTKQRDMTYQLGHR